MKGLRFGLLFAAVLGALLVLGSVVAFAQTSRGTVTGTVMDPTGGVIPDATVTLTNKETNVAREAKTNEAGIYRFDAVDLGTYRVTAKVGHFKDAVRDDIVIQANRIATLDFRLELGVGSVMVTVEATSTEILQTSDPLRGANFVGQWVANLPLEFGDPLNLMLLVPGVQKATTTQFSNGSNQYSVNGQRARANNFMIDGVENNDISVAGPAFQITNPDAITEVSVQTTQFSAEFGRAGGAVVNEITKSGTNSLHGSALWAYQSQVFNATSNSQRLSGAKKIPPVFVENIPSFSVGGPVYFGPLYDGRNKTFFFAAGQWDRFFSSALSRNFTVPTAAGVATLQALSSTCPNVALYLKAMGSLRGVTSPSNVSISVPSAAGSCDGTTRAGQNVEVGLVSRSAAQFSIDNNHIIRIDHIVSQKQTMSFRWLYDKNSAGPFFNNFDGFDRGFNGITLTGAFTDTYVIRPNWTNEFRFNYGRIGFNFPGLAPDDFHATLPNFFISGVTGFGLATNIPQFRFANNWQYQDTMAVTSGRHTFRFGVDFLRQLARQHPPFNERGAFDYEPNTGVTALANFIDDLGGTSGTISRQFGDSVYHPNLFRQSYFVQDNWKMMTTLTLNLGLRYENFGQPADTFKIPAFTGYDPANFSTPNQVNTDNNNFGPVVGFAWNPHHGKTVFRGGYQVTYDAFFNNLLSNIAGSSPNTLGGQITSPSTGRGTASFQSQLATIQATPPKPTDPQTNLFDPNIRNPYTQRWSFGLQRELPANTLLDLSYVGTVGHKLFQSLDVNPFVAPKIRFVNTLGQRTIRASSANSAYHSLQLDVRRRYASTPVGTLLVEGAYTWSHAIDNISEVFSTDSTASSFQSVPQVLGFSPRIDRGNADFDRRHRLAINWVWDIRAPKTGVLGQIVGGWTLSGITEIATGPPFTVRNGSDRNGDGQSLPDRPDIGNPNAPVNTRAVINTTTCAATGFRNTDTGTCVTPNDVFWVQGTGLPGPNTAGRNIVNVPHSVRFDFLVTKQFNISERVKFQYRASFTNLFNRENFGGGNTPVPALSVATSPATQFLNFALTDAPGRTMTMLLKLDW